MNLAINDENSVLQGIFNGDLAYCRRDDKVAHSN